MSRRAAEKHDRGAAERGTSAPRSWAALTLGAVLPVLVAVLLYRLRVPLGMPGRFVYLYSPVVGWRLAALPVALLLAALVASGVWFALGARVGRGRIGLALVALGAIGLAFWSYSAPPDHLKQHIFNMLSPSQDGAFLREAANVAHVREYLRDWPQRARTPPEQMRGTRVISNPPGTTLLALAVRRLLASSESVREYFRPAMELDDPESASFRDEAAVATAFCWALTVLWLLSGPLWYAVGRLFFPPAAAATFAVCCLISPMTLLFTPGKDPAQLLSVVLPLWLWLLAQRRGWRWAAAVSGAAFIFSCLVSLVHVWIAAAVVTASLLSARHTWGGLRRLSLRGLLPAVVGALAAAAGLYVCCGLDVTATAWAVARSQGELTRGPDAMPLAWQLLGIPLFLLFAGPALWTSTLWLTTARREMSRPVDEHARLGRGLAVGCVVVMAATAGFTNIETPRLWIPFVPLLLLAVALQLDVFRQPARPGPGLLVGLVFVQIAFSVLQWILMDMREAEIRLLEGRFFG